MLDSYAILAFLKQEPHFETVKNLLRNSTKSLGTLLMNQINAGEVYYQIAKQDLTEDMAPHFGVDEKTGVVVANVLEASPAQKAGIKEGDIIKRIDGIPTTSVRELLSVVGKIEVGKRVKVSVVRNKREMAIDVAIGERPQDITEMVQAVKPGARWQGIAVADLTPEIAREYRLQERTGVAVVEVEQGSAADEAGIMPGDVILEINRRPVDTVAEYNSAVQSVRGNVLIRTTRGYFLLKAGG